MPQTMMLTAIQAARSAISGSIIFPPRHKSRAAVQVGGPVKMRSFCRAVVVGCEAMRASLSQ